MNPRHLIVFLKAPRPGQVKTRLAAALDDEAAAAIYKVLVLRTLAAVRRARRPDTSLEVRFTPADAAAEIQPWLGRDATLADQGDGDLGDRLQRAFAQAFAGGARQVVVVGTDCPGLAEDDLLTAFSHLENHDLVLGPAEDGGYWLIGLRAPAPALFESIPWSTSSVFEETRRRAENTGLGTATLRRLLDVDTLDDWRRWQRADPA